MRFLHSADWHLGRVYHGVSLLEDQAHVLQQFVRVAADTRPDAVLLAGDIYDRSVPPAEAVRLLDLVLSELILELKIPVVMIAGNHDGPDRLAFGSGLLQRAGLTVRGPVELDAAPLVLRDAHGEVAVHALPYAEPALVRSACGDDTIADHHAALAAQTAAVRAAHVPGRRSVVVAHAFVQGGTESESERPLSVGGTGAVGAGVFDGFDYVALGHLHRPQAMAGGRIQYSGSLLKYSFAEADHAKSVNLVEMDAEGNCTVERIALVPRRDLRILEGELAALVAAAPADPARDDYVLARLTDHGALLDAMGKLRSAYPNALAIERPTLVGDGPGRATADHRRTRIQDLFASFHEETTGVALEPAAQAALDRVVDRLEQEARAE
ncbi:exonuclease SbcCD subunit D [Thauera sp.]|jgi:exonuclease SbcD|uniref:exonuclease SbcCD subunit D n=1 Tax=Thauera sp. TaxID=1905334 RepID=UPI002A364BDC|nr:exonuclease SbcCD subunit D [Thauera sp.]MDX9886869.1 exonuclease SbcCD subunit D [Thauera sp.]